MEWCQRQKRLCGGGASPSEEVLKLDLWTLDCSKSVLQFTWILTCNYYLLSPFNSTLMSLFSLPKMEWCQRQKRLRGRRASPSEEVLKLDLWILDCSKSATISKIWTFNCLNIVRLFEQFPAYHIVLRFLCGSRGIWPFFSAVDGNRVIQPPTCPSYTENTAWRRKRYPDNIILSSFILSRQAW